MDSRSLSPKTTFDYSKSPYYQSLLAFKKKTPKTEGKVPVVKESPILQQTISERKRTEEILASMELRVLKMKRKEEQAKLKLSTTKSRAELFSTTRLQFEEVTANQLEAAKQRKREENIQALMQKRKEILDKRLAQTQKMTSTKSELLDVKRVRLTQKRALELKETRISAINEMQERQLSLRLEKIKSKENQNSSKALHQGHVRNSSQNQDFQLQEEANKLRQAREKVSTHTDQSFGGKRKELAGHCRPHAGGGEEGKNEAFLHEVQQGAVC